MKRTVWNSENATIALENLQATLKAAFPFMNARLDVTQYAGEHTTMTLNYNAGGSNFAWMVANVTSGKKLALGFVSLETHICGTYEDNVTFRDLVVKTLQDKGLTIGKVGMNGAKWDGVIKVQLEELIG